MSRRAQLPNKAKKLRQNFNLTEEELKLAFALPHKIAYEPSVKAFQYKILNSILYANEKLFKIGYSEHDKCTFCDSESETLYHLFFYCSFSNIFWTHFEKYYFTLTKKSRVLSNQDVILGIITSPCPLLNYLTFNNYSPKWRWLAVNIYRAAKRRVKYQPLATDTEVNSCFSIY